MEYFVFIIVCWKLFLITVITKQIVLYCNDINENESD